MMKYIILPLLLFIPFVSMADDHCTNPNEYTIDKRCYVTDEQKETAPYNASVALVSPGYSYGDIKLIDGPNYCSGTIVKGTDGQPYLYTAAHCVEDTDSIILFKLPYEKSITRSAKIQSIGNYDHDNDKNITQDWAVYRVLVFYEFDKDIPMAELSNKKITRNGIEKGYDARVIGYGGLKIMSDKEIMDFKLRYYKFLSDKAIHFDTSTNTIVIDNEAFDLANDFNNKYKDGIDVKTDPVRDFLKSDTDFDLLVNINDSYNLKVSNCEYTSRGREIGCQGWGGNSGGGIFDTDGNLMAIFTRLRYKIGGLHHAGEENKKTAYTGANVPVKTLPQPDATTADVE